MKLLTLLLALTAGITVAAAADAVFVVNPGVADSSLSTTEVKNILLGTRVNWSNGPVKLVIQAGGAVHEAVIRQFTARSPDQFDKYWKKQVFTGNGVMPTVAKSDAEVITLVAETPGAIGYVATGTATDKVKVLEVK
jgi:ABC-type phosphate transport system substrate-binding protein